MEIFLHAGNVLYVVSYAVRDILTLRVLTIVAICSLVGYYITSGLWVAIAWSALFLLVNLVQVYRLLLERRPVQLSMDERRLYGLAFVGLDERHFKRIAAIGSWNAFEVGDAVVGLGDDVTHVHVVLEGAADVCVEDDSRGHVGPGQFIGEGGFLTDRPACASVVVERSMRVLSLPATALRELLEQRPEIRSGLQRIVSADLVFKLRAAPEPSESQTPAPA